MTGDHIYYKKSYKYQLQRDYTVNVEITGLHLVTEWISLDYDGSLTIRRGYAWDGASGPTIDTPSSMRGSLVHDALYQLMRLGLLEQSFRERADDLLHEICTEDGMIDVRADIWEMMVQLFAETAARAGSEQPILEAP